MRIVYVLTSLGMGGAEKQALAVAARMKERGHSIALLVLRPQLPEEWPAAVEMIHLEMSKTPASFFAGLVRARSFIANFRPDLLHSHSFHANVFARCLKLLVPRVNVLSTIHNTYEGGRLRMLGYWLTDPLSRPTVAVSKAVAHRFIELNAVRAQKCVVIVNGIDSTEFSSDLERRAHVRAKAGFATKESTFIWLATGRVAPAKDYPNLLRAFRQVRSQLPDAELWIAGAPPDGTVKRAAGGLESCAFGIVAERGLLENVRFLGLRRDVPALLDAADAFVSASAWEGMPLAIGEAMAMEKPIVATDVGGVREWVGNSDAVVPAQDSIALAEAMIAMMQRSVRERVRTGRASRERVKQHFSIEASADAWEAMYRELLAPPF
jgi:glycosyltransferase involved in cell wall biosynthesis